MVLASLLIMCQWFVFVSVRKYLFKRYVPVTRKLAYTVLGALGVGNFLFLRLGFDTSLLVPDSLARQVVLVVYFGYLGWVLAASLFFLVLGTAEGIFRFKDLVFSYAGDHTERHSPPEALSGEDVSRSPVLPEVIQHQATDRLDHEGTAEPPETGLGKTMASSSGNGIPNDVGDTMTSRRSFLKWSAAVGLATTTGFAGWGVAAAYREPDIEVFPFEHSALKGLSRDLVFVQVTDFHYGLFMRTPELEKLVATLNSIEADALFLTGDLLHSPMTPAREARPILKQLRSRRYGNFAVMGNHDFYAGERRAVRLFEGGGLRLLRDEWLTIKEGGVNLHLGGIDDPMENWLWGKDFPGFTSFMEKAPEAPGMRVLLSHRPNVLPLASQRGIDLILAGHTHGGQVILPLPNGRGGLSVARIASKFTHGWYTADKCRMYLSRGVGLTFVPWRVNCPPEIAVFHLKPPAAKRSPARHTGRRSLGTMLQTMRSTSSLLKG